MNMGEELCGGWRCYRGMTEPEELARQISDHGGAVRSLGPNLWKVQAEAVQQRAAMVLHKALKLSQSRYRSMVTGRGHAAQLGQSQALSARHSLHRTPRWRCSSRQLRWCRRTQGSCHWVQIRYTDK